ncbi:hypothetical protein AX17_005892 [Amanita inopinata Kibby_2008]|nr:hypothetical protein AX17_005892 [Amanita inopinata Kibby_2008]
MSTLQDRDSGALPSPFIGGLSRATNDVGPGVDIGALVYHLNLFIISLVAFVVLLRLPRGLARFWKLSEWCSGHLLRYIPYTERRALTQLPRQARVVREPSGKRGTRPPVSRSHTMEKGYASTDESHTLYTHANNAVRRLDSKGQPIRPSYPPHVPACPSFLRPLVGRLRTCIVPGLSDLQVLIMLTYFAILLYPFIYRSNFLIDEMPAAWIAISQLPFVFVFASKNNVLGWLLGVGYQRLNYLHRYIGRLVILAANIHSIGYFYQWSLTNTVSLNFAQPSNVWGLVALICFDLLFIFSTSLWRTKAYNVFLTSHTISYILIVPAIYLHQPSTLPYIIALSAPFCFDHLLRILKTRYVTATIRPLPSLSATRIEIPTLNSGWRAGQHVRVRILSASSHGLGLFGWMESHPFTIASAPVRSKNQRLAVGEEGLVLICKKAGGWTGRLFDMAKKGGYIESGMAAGGVDIGRSVKVLIEGPYAGPGHAIYASFSAVAMIVGGSGITFALSVIQDLVQKDLHGESRVKFIELVWMVQNPDAMTPLIPLFTALIDTCPSSLSISVYYTRAFAPRSEKHSNATKVGRTGSSNSRSSVEQLFPVIPQGLPLSISAGRPGRAGLIRVIESAIARTVSIGNNGVGGRGGAPEDDRGINGVLVGVCGPPGLGHEVNDVVNSIDSARKNQAGGVEIHEETFGF